MGGASPSKQETDRLEQARADLYAAFSAFTLPDVISYCGYCDDEAYERALHGPLHELTEDLVGKFVSDAFHHTGGAREFLHVLPRALELFHARQQGIASTELLAQGIAQSEPETWPPAAREAFQRYLVAAFAHEIATWDSDLAGIVDVRFGDYLTLGADVARLVDAWPRTPLGAKVLSQLALYDDRFRALSGLEPAAKDPPHPDLRRFVLGGDALARMRDALAELSAYDGVEVEVIVGILEALGQPAT